MDLRKPNEPFPEGLTNYLSDDPLVQLVWKRLAQDPTRRYLVRILLEDLIATAVKTCDDRPDQFSSGTPGPYDQDYLVESSSDLERSGEFFSELEEEPGIVSSEDDSFEDLDAKWLHRDDTSSEEESSKPCPAPKKKKIVANDSSSSSEELPNPHRKKKAIVRNRSSEEDDDDSSGDDDPSDQETKMQPVHTPTKPICVISQNRLLELLYQNGDAECWASLLREMAMRGHVNHLRYWLEGQWISRQIAKDQIFAVLLKKYPEALDQFWQIAIKYDRAILSAILDAKNQAIFQHVFWKINPSLLQRTRVANFAALLPRTSYWFALNRASVPKYAHPNLIAKCYRRGLIKLGEMGYHVSSNPAKIALLLERLAMFEPDVDQLVYYLVDEERYECAKVVDQYYQITPEIRLARSMSAGKHDSVIIRIIKHLEPDLLAHDGYFFRKLVDYDCGSNLVKAIPKLMAQSNCQYFVDQDREQMILVSNYPVVIPGFFHWRTIGTYFCSPHFRVANGDLWATKTAKKVTKREHPAKDDSSEMHLVEYGRRYSEQVTCTLPLAIRDALRRVQASGGFTRAKSARSAMV